MSAGYGAACKKETEDSLYVLYKYYSYDLNEDRFKNPEKKYDGMILIKKAVLVKPEIRSKIKRLPSGKKISAERKLFVEIDLSEMIAKGNIEISNSSYASQFAHNGVDMMAIRLCRKLFREYQEIGTLPEHCGYHV